MIACKGWIVAGAFLILFAAERLYPAVRAAIPNPGQRLLKNLSFWPLNIALSFAVTLPVSAFATNHALWARHDAWQGGLPALTSDILLLDLFLYWWHRALHNYPFLWRFHEVHHLDRHLDTTSAIRFHSGEIFFSAFARALLIAVAAIPFSSVLIFETLVLILALFHHSNIRLPGFFESMLSRAIVTPSIHWVHHHAVRRDTDSNYGTILSVWDRLFHTKSATKRSESMAIGVEGKEDERFTALLTKPFTGTQPR